MCERYDALRLTNQPTNRASGRRRPASGAAPVGVNFFLISNYFVDTQVMCVGKNTIGFRLAGAGFSEIFFFSIIFPQQHTWTHVSDR